MKSLVLLISAVFFSSASASYIGHNIRQEAKDKKFKNNEYGTTINISTYATPRECKQQTNTINKKEKKEKSVEITTKLIKKQQEELIKRAKKEGLSFRAIEMINNLQYIKRAKKLNNNQPEVKLTFDKYYKRAMPEWILICVNDFYNANKDMINDIEKKYQVDKQALMILMSMETKLGNYTGSFNTLDALFTLTFDRRRSSFFAKELLSMLKIITNDLGPAYHNKGSWAGAFGLVQFMPSTFLKFAQDIDKDGRINLYHKEEALSSAANYLNAIGWKKDERMIIKMPQNIQYNQCDSGLTFEQFLESRDQMQADAIRQQIYSKYPDIINKKAYIVNPDRDNNPEHFYLVFDNYARLLDWNRSLFFATSISLRIEDMRSQNYNLTNSCLLPSLPRY